jgi:hypothetical protein
MTQPPWQQPYEQPQQPYGQQQQPYGQPQQPYGQPPYGGGYPPPVKQGNGFAVAGIILAIFVPILGLIFSIIGLVQSKARAGAGKALSIVGIVLSVIVGGGAAIAIAVLANNVANSTAADPGCISAESDSARMNSTLTADGNAINRDQNNPTAVRGDLQKFQTDMQALRGQLSSAQAEARHQSVKTRIAALTGDISALSTSLQAIMNGDVSQASQVTSIANKLQSDGNALVSTCSTL